MGRSFFKSLGRLSRDLAGGGGNNGLVDQIRRRDTLGVSKAFEEVGADSDNLEKRINDLYDLLQYLNDEGQIVWAWCHMQGGGGSVQKLQSYNVQSVTLDGNRYLVTYERAIESQDYASVACLSSSGGTLHFGTAAESSTGIRVQGFVTTTGAAFDVSSTGQDASLIVFGRLRDGATS